MVRWLLPSFVAFLACASSPPTPSPPPRVTAPASSGSRLRATARSSLSAALRPLVPAHGLYAAGGGLQSSPWRVQVTLDGEVRAGSSPNGGASSLSLAADQRTRLDASALRSLTDLAERVRLEPRLPNPYPTADYDEILVLADGDEVIFLDGFGPIHGGAAEELVRRLRQVAGLP